MFEMFVGLPLGHSYAAQFFSLMKMYLYWSMKWFNIYLHVHENVPFIFKLGLKMDSRKPISI